MGTPNTAELRGWARANGYDVGDRGRISQDVVDAFVAAGGKAAPRPAGAKPAAKKAATKAPKKAARKAPSARKAPARSTAGTGARGRASAGASAQPEPAGSTAGAKPTPSGSTSAVPSPAASAERTPLDTLAGQVRALEARVAGLERAASAPRRLFGRRS